MPNNLLPAGDAPAMTSMYRMNAATRLRLRVSVQWLRRRLLWPAAIAAAVALAVAGAAYYWSFARFMVSTDDAYVQADSTIVASRVSGYVAAVLIEDHQQVPAGEVLARIDDRDFRASLDQARADVRASQAAVDDLQAQLTEQNTLIARARAGVSASQATLDLANLNRVRYQSRALPENGRDRLRVRAAVAGSRCSSARARRRS
jgi:membrane fusion protein, multidrug efflux system